MQTLNVYASPTDTRTMFLYVWHIILAENMVFGVAFILMSVHKDLSKVSFTAWIIVFLIIVRWIIILGSTIFYNVEDFKSTWKESIAFMVFISIIILGFRKKDKKIHI